MTPQNRIVHYVLSNGECRPFLVTKAWSDVTVNGTVFIDGSNDYSAVPSFTVPYPYPQTPILEIWKTSRAYASIDTGQILTDTWHWSNEHD